MPVRYGVAVASVALAFGLKMLIDPLVVQQTPFLLLFGAIMLSAWYGGLGPGILATVLAALITDYFFLYPRGSFSGLSADALPLAAFFLEGVFVSALAAALRSATIRAKTSAREARSHEERFRLLVEGVQDYAIFMLDPDGRLASWNEGAERIEGYRAEEVLGRHFSVFYTAEDIERGHPENELRVAASEGSYEEEGIRVRKDGSRFWASVLITALRDEGGNLRGFSKVVRDITERREAEQELKESEELFRATFEQAAVGMAHVSILTRWLKANDRLCQMLGYTEEEMLRLGFQEVTHPDDLDADFERFNRVLSGELHTYSAEKRYVRKDGSLIWINQTLSVVREASGRLGHFLCIVEDITERKRSEEAFRRSFDSLLALYEAGQVLGSSLERDEIGSRLLEFAQRVSGLEAAILGLGDKEGLMGEWCSVGQEEVLAEAREHPGVSSAVEEVTEGGRTRAIELRQPPNPGSRTVLTGVFVPLRARGRVIGVLEAYGPPGLAEKGTTETLSSLAGQAAAALENARLYEELAERERALHDLVGRLLVAEEEERRRVAYEVHDGLTQTAAAAYRRLALFAEHRPPESAQDREELEDAIALVRRTVGEARRVIANLRPTTLDDFGLATAIRMQTEELRAEGYEITYEEKLGEARLPAKLETAFFRVAQEALTNVRKHAETDQVCVALGLRDGTVRLGVSDRGRGFAPAEVERGEGPGERVGLSGMRERIALLGGRLEIRSEPGAGTSVVAEVPLAATGEEVDGGE